MGISVTDPISQAFDRSVRMLFKPFDIGKWLTLGFCAFLAHLAEGAGGNFNFPGGGGGGGGGVPAPGPGRFPGPGVPPAPPIPPAPPASDWDEIKQFLLDNAYWIGPVVLVLIMIWVALVWVAVRGGKFLFLEGVAYDRAAVVEPWKRLAKPANAFFRFQLMLTFLMVVSFLAIAALSLYIAWADIQAEQMTGAGIAAIVIGAVLFTAAAIGFALIGAIAEDFLIPLMYLRGGSVGTAWGEFRQSLLPGNFLAFLLFFVLKFLLSIGMGLIMFVGMCVTCCIAVLPYVSSVVFLPLFVFFRAYSLYFLRQFGPQYNLVAELPPPSIGAAFPVIMNPPPPPADGGDAQWPNPQS